MRVRSRLRYHLVVSCPFLPVMHIVHRLPQGHVPSGGVAVAYVQQIGQVVLSGSKANAMIQPWPRTSLRWWIGFPSAGLALGTRCPPPVPFWPPTRAALSTGKSPQKTLRAGSGPFGSQSSTPVRGLRGEAAVVGRCCLIGDFCSLAEAGSPWNACNALL